VTVAFQGAAGAYSEAAALERFGPAAMPVGYDTFEAAVRASARGEARAVVVPVRNSTTGDVVGAREAVAMGLALGLVRDGDIQTPIRHALLALPGVALGAVRRVRSHPQALAQTARWLAAHVPYAHVGPGPAGAPDTAGAALDLARTRRMDTAVVAHASAADRYGLAVLADGIEDQPDNATTFAVLVRRG
jgi:prephenate dehydratase